MFNGLLTHIENIGPRIVPDVVFDAGLPAYATCERVRGSTMLAVFCADTPIGFVAPEGPHMPSGAFYSENNTYVETRLRYAAMGLDGLR